MKRKKIMIIVILITLLLQINTNIIVEGARVDGFNDNAENLAGEGVGVQDNYIEMELAHPVAGKNISIRHMVDKIPDFTVQKTSIINRPGITPPSKNDFPPTEVNISSFATHTHTDNCYSGHRHTSSCYVPHTHKYINHYGEGVTAVADYRYQVLDEICALSGLSAYCWAPKEFEFRYTHNTYGYMYGVTYVAEVSSSGIEQYVLKSYRSAWNYPTMSLPQVIGFSQFSKLKYSSDFRDFWARATGETINFDNYKFEIYMSGGLDLCNITPDFPYKLVCGQVQDETPDCSSVITSISANYPNQEVVKGGTINTTVKATYLDGHSATITCTSNFNSNTIGMQTVTLATPYGLINTAKTSGTKTCTITVNVKAVVSSIKANMSKTSINKGEAFPITSVTVTYNDGSTFIDTTGWTISGFNTNTIGVQNVTVSYGGASTVVQITVNKVATSIKANMSKTSINKGEAFPITSVTITYNDGSTSTVTSGWTISGFNTNTIGAQNVTVSYGGLSTVVQITVNKVATSITANLSKTTINRGEAFPITSLTVTYNDGSTSTVTSGWTISGFNTNTIGMQNVTVSYGGISKLVQITVSPNTYYVYTFEYDQNGRVSFALKNGIRIIKYIYDKNGNLISKELV